jgi:hypothetical protein
MSSSGWVNTAWRWRNSREQRAQERAERERAAVDEPVVHADVQAGLEAAADAKAEADDAELEI